MAHSIPDFPEAEHALLGSDADVVQTLVANHRRFLEFLERRVGNRADAEDILQQAFIRGLAGVKSLRDGESAIAWFYRALRNAVIDHHRRRDAVRRLEDRIAADVSEEDPSAELKAEICRCVSALAETLKPEYAAAIRRVEVDGLPVESFAAEVGITANNAGVRLFRAREALRKRVVASCGTCATHGCLDCTCASKSGGRA